MPGVASDGKKIMKLIPGVMVNGKFVQTPGIQGLQTGVAHKLLSSNGSAALTSKKMVLDAPFAQQVINKVSLLNSTTSQVAVKSNNVPNKQLTPHKYILVNQPLGAIETPVPTCPVVLRAQSLPRGQNGQLQNQKYFILKKPSVSTATVPAANEKPQILSQPPVTVKSVALPGGIPLNAEDRTVPVSELPAVIKKPLPTSTPGSVSGSRASSGLPNVVSITPNTAAKQKATPPSLKETIQPSYKYFPGPGLQGGTKQLKLVQKAPQGHHGPCKWVIEEVEAAASEDPSPITPKAPSALTGRMELIKQRAVIPGPDPDSRPSRSMSGRSDAVVVCNGKVFVVANKGKDSSATHKLSKPLSEQREKEQDSGGGTSGRFMEVIDLCEDDDNGLSTSSQDDDNVIFVSYLPPKPGAPDLQCGSAEDVESMSPEALKHAKPSQQEVVEEEKGVAVEEVVEEELVAEELLEEEVVEEHIVAEEDESPVKDMVPAQAVEEERTIGGTEVRTFLPSCLVTCAVRH